MRDSLRGFTVTSKLLFNNVKAALIYIFKDSFYRLFKIKKTLVYCVYRVFQKFVYRFQIAIIRKLHNICYRMAHAHKIWLPCITARH